MRREPEPARIARYIVADEQISLGYGAVQCDLVLLPVPAQWLLEQDVCIDAVEKKIVRKDDVPQRTHSESGTVRVRVANAHHVKALAEQLIPQGQCLRVWANHNLIRLERRLEHAGPACD